jgi:hypothetical protein
MTLGPEGGPQAPPRSKGKRDSVTGITEQMTGLSDYACREIWGDDL